jgi:1-deoxy-D-xylulose-5-phosphate synthase
MYHGPSTFNPSEGIVASTKPKKTTFTQIFGDWICDMAAVDSRLVAVTPAMREGSGLVEFESIYPSRYFDVGIAEQHAATFAAGLACDGLKPVLAIYSTFLQRAYDQVIHDIALQNLDVTFAIDRAGLVGADGATHAGAYDIAYLRCVPNIAIATPSDEAEARGLLSTAYQHNGPAAVRYPRGSGIGAEVSDDLAALPFGKANIVRQGEKIAILAFGTLLHIAQRAANESNATLVDMRWVKPLDEALLHELVKIHTHFVTIEDSSVAGGAGSAVAQWMIDHGFNPHMLNLGLPDQFIDHGEVAVLLAEHGLSEDSVASKVRDFVA